MRASRVRLGGSRCRRRPMAAAMQRCCRVVCMATSAPAVIFCKLSRRSRWAHSFPTARPQQSSDCQHVRRLWPRLHPSGCLTASVGLANPAQTQERISSPSRTPQSRVSLTSNTLFLAAGAAAAAGGPGRERGPGRAPADAAIDRPAGLPQRRGARPPVPLHAFSSHSMPPREHE